MVTNYRLIMLALVQGRSWSQITSDLGCSRSSIDKASRVLRSTGMDEDAITALSAQELSELFPDNRRRDSDAFVEPDFTGIAARRRRGERVTLKVEHHKYTRRQAASGQQHYSYRQFCALFENYVDVNDLTALLTHAPGEELCVDWSGETMAVVDPLTGVCARAYVFVASLPHSGLIHASAWPDMRMRSWLCAHRDALDYIGGVPVRIVPDNASTATNQVARGATVREVNERYQLFAEFYGCGITPARPGKPRDKAHVEKAVDIVQTWVAEALSGQEFATFEALNAAIAAQVDWINDREGFRGRKTTRRQLFVESEAEALRPLPQQRWSYSTWRTAKAGVNYHVQVEKHFYSVPWSFAGKRVDVQIFDDVVDIFSAGERIATHLKKPGNMQYSTDKEHVPAKHQDLATKWDRGRIESWAQSIGAATYELIRQMFHARQVEAQAYNSALGVLSLSKKYSRSLLEQACQDVLDSHMVPSVRKVHDTIKDLATRTTATATATGGAQSPTSSAASTRPVTRPAPPAQASHVRGKAAFEFSELEFGEEA